LYVHCAIYIKEDREHFSRGAQEIPFYKIYQLRDEIGELKELENAACGWKSCNIGRNEKRCENTEDLKPHPQNRICVHLYLLRVLFKISDEQHLFKHGSPPPRLKA